jgi:hypothetical protein
MGYQKTWAMNVEKNEPRITNDRFHGRSDHGRIFSTRVFEIRDRQIIYSQGSLEPFDGMKLSVNAEEVVHRWPDDSIGVVDLRTGKYSGRIPVDTDGNQGSVLADTGNSSSQACVVEVRHEWWMSHNGSPVLLLP